MKIIVDDIATEYQDEGAGPVLLFLHGWKDSLRTFDALLPHFETQRTLRLDLPGFGKSENPPKDWSLDDYVRFVRNFLQKIGVSELEALVGHSFGGRIAIKGTAEKVFVPKKIILIASGGIAKGRTPRNILFGLIAKVGKLFVFFLPSYRRYLQEKLYKRAGSDYLNAGPLRETFLRVIREDLRETAKKISVATLLLWGEDDRETPLRDAQIFHEKIKGSELYTYSARGHFLHQEIPEKIAESIRKFLSV